MHQTQKTEQDDMSIIAIPTNLNSPVLSTVTEISRVVQLVLQIKNGNHTIFIPAKQQFSTT